MPTVLEIPAGHSRFLRRLFESAQEHVKKELEHAQGCTRSRLQLEEAAYGELLSAVDSELMEPDLNAQMVLADLASAIDADNEYQRIVDEHEALRSLLVQMPEACL